MTIATVGLDGHPDARTVLARGADDRSLVFFTNFDSVKSRQLERHPHAAAVFAWLELHRQVRLRGSVERVADDESDDYFASRPRESKAAVALLKKLEDTGTTRNWGTFNKIQALLGKDAER